MQGRTKFQQGTKLQPNRTFKGMLLKERKTCMLNISRGRMGHRQPFKNQNLHLKN